MRALFITLFAILTVSVAMPAHALTVGPVKQDVVLRPGESARVKIDLFNESDSTKVLYVDIKDFDAADDTGRPLFVERVPEDSLTGWVSFPRRQVTLTPGMRQEYTFTLSVPPGTRPGGYFGGVMFSETSPQGGAVGLSASIASLLLVRVDGDIRENAEILNFSVTEENLSHLPVQFAAHVANMGDVHVLPTGTITIENMFGATVAEVPVNTTQGFVLPGSTRSFAATWEKSLLDENASEFVRQYRNYAFGPHTATLSLSFGADAQIIEATTRFWVMPWMIVGLGALIAIIVLFALWKYMAWVRRHVR